MCSSAADWPQCCTSVFPTNLSMEVVEPLLAQLQLYWSDRQLSLLPSPPPVAAPALTGAFSPGCRCRVRPNEQDPPVRELNASLYQHEWAKHGTCSALPQLDFLTAALNLTAALPTPAVINDNIGGSVSRDKLESSYNGGQPCSADGCQVFLQCSAGYLLEVHTCYSPQLERVGCPTTVTGQAERCKSNVKISKFADSLSVAED